jgi:ubiquinone/menaquinone biosynthesis C-methylase UbiE
MTTISKPSTTPTTPTPSPTAALKARQQATWASGDYALIGATINLVAENLCEAADIGAAEQVLDVATGSGNAAIAAARRFADVTGIDYVPSLIAQARDIARALRLPVTFEEGDAENLPFVDATFDAVLSTFGVMFTADHEAAAAQLLRVTRKGGRIAMANWRPTGFIGEMFQVVAKHVKPAPGALSPLLWGTRGHLEKLFKGHAIRTTPRLHTFHYRSARHWLELFKTTYGPTLKAFESLDTSARAALDTDLLACFTRLAATDTTGPGVAVRAEYIEAIVTR